MDSRALPTSVQITAIIRHIDPAVNAIFELEPLLPTLSHALLARADRVTRMPILALPAVIPDLFPTSALDGLERILGIV